MCVVTGLPRILGKFKNLMFRSPLSMQVHKYYQPRKSHRRVSAVIHGDKVPLYGAGGGLSLSSNGGSVPLTVDFELISRGYVIGKLMWVTHKVHVTCHITINSKTTGPIRFFKKACTVYKA
jgi:hypothetical protein